MTSKQVMLSVATLVLCSALAGCRTDEPAVGLRAPYEGRQVWAVAPLANESGTLQADGVAMADHLARQLENAEPIDVVPVSRVLAAMEAAELGAVTSPQEAGALRETLGVDALLVGTISAYDPYDPPKLGLTVELYLDPGRMADPVDVRRLSRTATADGAGVDQAVEQGGPASSVSGVFDAADPSVREEMRAYAERRGLAMDESAGDWRLYRISMDLYSEFVSHLVSSRLLDAEARRLRAAQPEPTEGPAS